MRVLSPAVGPRLFCERFLFPKHTRALPRDRVQHDERRQLTAREDVGADGQGLVLETVEDALVNALVPSAEESESVVLRETDRLPVRKEFPGRGRDDDACLFCLRRLATRLFRPQTQTNERLMERLDLHDHAGPASERLVVPGLVPVMRPASQLVDADVEKTLLL